MTEMRGFITFLDGEVEDDEGNVTFAHYEVQNLEREILKIAEGRIEFVQRYNDFHQTIIFLGDLRKRSVEPMIVLKELRDLLVPLEVQMAGVLKVHLLCKDDENDETLLLQIGRPDEPLE